MLTRPAIDRNIIRSEAVRTFELRHGDWIVRCDEVAVARTRVCNLIAPVRDATGRDRGVLIIATDASGRLGVMVKMLAPLVVAHPLIVAASFPVERKGSKRKPVLVQFRKEARAVPCSETCGFVFPADPKLIFALNGGNDLHIDITTPTRPAGWAPLIEIRSEALRVSASGFAKSLSDVTGAGPR